jgi:hypothetical protein
MSDDPADEKPAEKAAQPVEKPKPPENIQFREGQIVERKTRADDSG